MKLVGCFSVKPCPLCDGTGKIPQPTTWTTRFSNHKGPFMAPGDGHPIPCPKCNGKKVVPSHDQPQQ